MGKISTKKPQHSPLYKEINAEGGKLRTKPRNKKKGADDDDGLEKEAFLDASTSRKILQLAKEQQEEIENENGTGITNKYKFQLAANEDESENSEEEELEEYTFGEEELEDFEVAEEQVDEKDVFLFEKYLSENKTPVGAHPAFNLADKIAMQLEQLEQEKDNAEEEEEQEGVLLPPKVIAAYTKVGIALSTWTHGKLPKLFKVLPGLNNWEDVLYVTNPEKWTPHVCYEATKLFVSNLTASEAQKFLNMVLLDRVRDNIRDDPSHQLNYHLYRALKKSLYKPSAFYKGFLYPLVQEGCTTREALIVGSMLTKVSIPVLHSAAALSHLLTMEYTPATTFFIKVLLEKNYSLPYQTIDDCVFYFMKFRVIKDSERMAVDDYEDQPEPEALPVVWHKAFLAFAQRYKNEITDDQRDFLLETVKQRFHKAIGPEIRRELLAGKPRMGKMLQETEPEMVDIF